MTKIVSEAAHRVWVVEVWANSSWGRMSKWAFVDNRKPELIRRTGYLGNFDIVDLNLDVSQHESRCTTPVYGDRTGKHGPPGFHDIVAFTEEAPALVYANRLARHGRWSHYWEPRYEDEPEGRKQRLRVRVVEEHKVSLIREVRTWPAPTS